MRGAAPRFFRLCLALCAAACATSGLVHAAPGAVVGAAQGAAQGATPGAPAESRAGTWQARVEIDLRLPASTGSPAVRVRELSALAWDAARAQLVAVSDRGLLLRFAPPASSSADVRFEHAVELVPADAGSRRANVEALTWRAPGTARAGQPDGLWLAEEHGPGPRAVDANGRVVAGLSWPPALASALGQGRHGIEAMTWDARHGFVAGLQRPHPWVEGAAARHALHAADGRQWHFRPGGRGSSLKAVEALADGGWLLLERTTAPGGGYRTVLRRLDPDRCAAVPPSGAATPAPEPPLCDTEALPVVPPLEEGPDNFEGLACAGDGRCWIVSDGGTASTAPTRLVQWRLERRP